MSNSIILRFIRFFNAALPHSANTIFYNNKEGIHYETGSDIWQRRHR